MDTTESMMGLMGIMESITHTINTVSPVYVYAIVGLVVLVESIGIPLPGEIILITGSLLAVTNKNHHSVSLLLVAICGIVGAIIGDNIGYLVGRSKGRQVLDWFGKKFPKHFSPETVDKATQTFEHYGVFAVFFGRFVALLRIFAGPVSGILKFSYPKFFLANASGAIVWIGSITLLIHFFGRKVVELIEKSSNVLLVAFLLGLVIYILNKFRTRRTRNKERPTRTTTPGTQTT